VTALIRTPILMRGVLHQFVPQSRQQTDRCGGDGARRDRFRGGAGRRDLPKPIVSIAAVALCGCAGRPGVFAGGGCAGARRAARGRRYRVCERRADAVMRLTGAVDASTVKAMVAVLAKAWRR
jgi:hypothetical protein